MLLLPGGRYGRGRRPTIALEAVADKGQRRRRLSRRWPWAEVLAGTVGEMRVLLVGAGGVGTAFARIAARRGVFEHIVVADHSLGRAERRRAGRQ